MSVRNTYKTLPAPSASTPHVSRIASSHLSRPKPRPYSRACPHSSVVAATSNDIKKSEHDSVGLNCLRSISPYVSCRKIDRDSRVGRSLYSTPQVGPTFSDDSCDGGKTPSSNKRLEKFWILSNLFQSRSNQSKISSRESCNPSTVSPSWFSTILPARLQNRRHGCQQSDHGISTEVSFTEESPQRWKNTVTVAVRVGREESIRNGDMLEPFGWGEYEEGIECDYCGGWGPQPYILLREQVQEACGYWKSHHPQILLKSL